MISINSETSRFNGFRINILKNRAVDDLKEFSERITGRQDVVDSRIKESIFKKGYEDLVFISSKIK
jgi:hypothetical protein